MANFKSFILYHLYKSFRNSPFKLKEKLLFSAFQSAFCELSKKSHGGILRAYFFALFWAFYVDKNKGRVI
jgi:hypothetical protein